MQAQAVQLVQTRFRRWRHNQQVRRQASLRLKQFAQKRQRAATHIQAVMRRYMVHSYLYRFEHLLVISPQSHLYPIL